ncbi:MAG: hypothetical protein AABZ61_14895, partial [Bacteroidota bacterium]
ICLYSFSSPPNFYLDCRQEVDQEKERGDQAGVGTCTSAQDEKADRDFKEDEGRCEGDGVREAAAPPTLARAIRTCPRSGVHRSVHPPST